MTKANECLVYLSNVGEDFCMPKLNYILGCFIEASTNFNTLCADFLTMFLRSKLLKNSFVLLSVYTVIILHEFFLSE